MKKHNLLDTTFIIPVRIDTIDRLENLIACTKHILKSFNTNIIVIDGDMRNKKILKYLLNKKIQYIYCEDSDNVFYRTYYINKVVSKIQSTYLAIWDTDIIAPIEQIIESVNVLRHGNADFVLPYNGFALNVPICVKNIYFRHNSNIRILEKFKEGMHFMYGAKCTGGGFFANRTKYIEAGMENENFYGWGYEDGERFNRWDILGYTIYRTDGVIYHLNHSRGLNSWITNKTVEIRKLREFYRITYMTKTSLTHEVQSWKKSVNQMTSF